MAKQIVFEVGRIDGDAFDSAEVVLPEALGGTHGGSQLMLRKKPGRTTYHQLVLTPEEQIPEPEREIDVTVNLYQGETLVGTGTDAVAPPDKPADDDVICDPGCVTT